MTDLSAFVRAVVVAGSLLPAACGISSASGDGVDPGNSSDSGTDPGGDPGADPGDKQATKFEVALDGPAGVTRVSFAIPLAPGALADAADVRFVAGGRELPAARRALARYPDGGPRSVQIQVDVDPAAAPALQVELGVRGTGDLAPVAVETTLIGTGADRVPRVWALLPAEVLAASGVAGPMVPRGSTPSDAWSALCDYDRWDTDAFLGAASSRDVWLYDRVTAMYRGYAITGESGPLRSAYREAGIYRAGITIANGVATKIGVPTAADDLKYHYAQGLALHYLLTGDDRYREAAEAISARVAKMWNPHYSGGDEFWTERHAGFALLAHEWALRVTDDRASEIAGHADKSVDEFLAAQRASRAGSDPDARCFAHSAGAHGEPYGTVGCSPWMSAILADGLDAYATRSGGPRAEEVRAALGRLGRILARKGRDSTGRPYYWMALEGASEVDEYDEHWGESAYVIALAWRATGRTDAGLFAAAGELINGLRTHGEVGQLRSFNWQCRSAVMTPALLR
jgi:hypothetical protein